LQCGAKFHVKELFTDNDILKLRCVVIDPDPVEPLRPKLSCKTGTQDLNDGGIMTCFRAADCPADPPAPPDPYVTALRCGPVLERNVFKMLHAIFAAEKIVVELAKAVDASADASAVPMKVRQCIGRCAMVYAKNTECNLLESVSKAASKKTKKRDKAASEKKEKAVEELSQLRDACFNSKGAGLHETSWQYATGKILKNHSPLNAFRQFFPGKGPNFCTHIRSSQVSAAGRDEFKPGELERYDDATKAKIQATWTTFRDAPVGSESCKNVCNGAFQLTKPVHVTMKKCIDNCKGMKWT